MLFCFSLGTEDQAHAESTLPTDHTQPSEHAFLNLFHTDLHKPDRVLSLGGFVPVLGCTVWMVGLTIPDPKDDRGSCNYAHTTVRTTEGFLLAFHCYRSQSSQIWWLKPHTIIVLRSEAPSARRVLLSSNPGVRR